MMKRLVFNLSLFQEYIGNYFKTRLTYRADFWVEVFSDLLSSAMNLVFIFIVFQHTPSLAGWSQAEILFIYGYFLIAYGVFGTFVNFYNFTERYIVKGEMDRILTRPAHSAVQILLENVEPPALASAVVGLVIMGSAWASLGLPFDWYDPIMFVVMLAGSLLLYTGVYMALAAISFYSDAPTGIMPLMYNLLNYGRYPVQIYNKTIRFLITWILPFAFVGVFPASFFLDHRPEDAATSLLTPVMGVIFFSLGLAFWNRGVRRYRGAGS